MGSEQVLPPSRSGSGINGHEGLPHTFKTFRTEASPLDKFYL